MPILAICPYCREGRVHASEDAVGMPADCPQCQNSFTILASDVVARSSNYSAVPGPASAGSLAAAITSEPAMTADAGPVVANRALPPCEAGTKPPPAAVLPPVALVAPLPIADESLPRKDYSLPPALIAIILAGVSLAISQTPPGRILCAFVAALGLLLGLGTLVVAEQKRRAPLLAVALNLLVLLVVILLPGWLGLTSWLPPPADDSRFVKAFAHDGSGTLPAEWVDVSRSSWQFDDVRVTARLIREGPVELIGPDNQKRWTTERWLQIWLEVKNAGVARKLEFKGWALSAASGRPVPRLTDAKGKELALKTFSPPWQPAGRPESAALLPGKSAAQLLIFERPAPMSDHLRLELPGEAFGETEPVKFRIPRSSVLSWSSP